MTNEEKEACKNLFSMLQSLHNANNNDNAKLVSITIDAEETISLDDIKED